MTMEYTGGFQGILNKLYEFWLNFGCLAIPSAQTEISSPIFHPVSFFNLITDKNINLMYLQPHVASREFDNMRFGFQNYTFLKFQVVIKNRLENPQKIVLDSLNYLGLNTKKNNVVFKNEDYENFIFRFNTCGYKTLFNGVSVVKFHYVQNIGSHNFENTPIIILYNIDKILTILQNKNNLWDTKWGKNSENQDVFYSDLMLNSEKENYDFVKNKTTNNILLEQLKNFKIMAQELIDNDIIVPAYTTVLKAKYCLDILCLRNFIMYNDKLDHSKALRNIVDLCCEKYLLKYFKEKNG